MKWTELISVEIQGIIGLKSPGLSAKIREICGKPLKADTVIFPEDNADKRRINRIILVYK